MKILIASLLVLTTATAAFGWVPVTNVPEIDAASATAAVALVGGGLMVLRARRKR